MSELIFVIIVVIAAIGLCLASYQWGHNDGYIEGLADGRWHVINGVIKRWHR